MGDGKQYECCIIGAGPAGIGTALELSKQGINDFIMIDKNDKVGGLSRTNKFDGIGFDIGPHRFFTKNNEVSTLWAETLGKDFRPVDRLTRIYYKKKFFNYPIKASDAIIKLGPVEAAQAFLSYCQAMIFLKKEPVNFEEWVTQNFGGKLYKTFFKTYTEKVFGIPCSEIGVEWASQRIKGIDIFELIKKSIILNSNKKSKTIEEQFDYPKYGAGQMYEIMCEKALSSGGTIFLNSQVTAINRVDNKIESIELKEPTGKINKLKAKWYFSSIPLTHLFKLLKPFDSPEVNIAADNLYYRDHITVNILARNKNYFPDQWIYIHEPDVKMSRLTNFNRFSEDMVGGANKTALSVEYFVFQGDSIWNMSDLEIQELAVYELGKVGLVPKDMIEHMWVLRETEAYPTLYIGFNKHFNILKQRINELRNIYTIGRSGMYKYNNQDHSLYSGILAARNYCKAPGAPFNIWSINEDPQYHEDAFRNESL